MKAIVVGLVTALLAAQVTLAADTAASTDTRASEASVRELFRTMNTRGIIDSARAQTESSSGAMLGAALTGRQLNEQQRQILRDGQQQIMALVSEQLDWNTLEPLMVEVYRDHFTQQEIDQMLKFYRSPAGQMVIAKLPAATQDMMQKIQGRIQALGPRIAELRKETAAKVKSAADEPAAAQQPVSPR